MGKKNRNNRKALENVKEACLLENYESHYLHLQKTSIILCAATAISHGKEKSRKTHRHKLNNCLI